jgi:hypothetical protein
VLTRAVPGQFGELLLFQFLTNGGVGLPFTGIEDKKQARKGIIGAF